MTAPANPDSVQLLTSLDSLALEPGVAPRVGDTVDITGEARVVAIKDGEARLELLKVNDSTPRAPAPASPEPDSADASGPDAEEAALEEQAREIDRARYL